MDKLETLTQAWKAAKAQEEYFKESRIAIESEIYEMVEQDLSDKGTHTLATGLKIATGYSEDWNQEVLASAYDQWPVESVRFPFSRVYKPDGKAITVIRENIPDLYRIIQSALTLKPKKPSFTIPETK